MLRRVLLVCAAMASACGGEAVRDKTPDPVGVGTGGSESIAPERDARAPIDALPSGHAGQSGAGGSSGASSGAAGAGGRGEGRGGGGNAPIDAGHTQLDAARETSVGTGGSSGGSGGVASGGGDAALTEDGSIPPEVGPVTPPTTCARSEHDYGIRSCEVQPFERYSHTWDCTGDTMKISIMTYMPSDIVKRCLPDVWHVEYNVTSYCCEEL